MSKRFGRNQRRRAREKILRLQSAYDRDHKLVEYQHFKLKEAEDVISGMVDAIEAICPYSSVIPAKKVVGDYMPPSYRIQSHAPMPFYEVRRDVANQIDLKTIDLYALKLFVQKHYNDFNMSVHLVFEAGEESGYMISERALRDMPENELVKRFAPRIAKELIRHLRNRQ